MKVENFRIGNLVQSKQWRGIGIIDGLKRNEISFEVRVKGYVHSYKTGDYFDLEEIELCEEILLRFGFIEEETNQFVLRQSPIIFQIHRNLISGEFMFRINPQFSVLVRTATHLQNLFFALTTSELEFKDKIN